jgi:predicted nucleotide-binding protein
MYRIESLPFHLEFNLYQSSSKVTVAGSSRAKVEAVFEAIERHVESCRVPEVKQEEPKVRHRVFIGHGRSSLWRDLKDHLQDLHGYEVEAYETGARAGHTIRDVLEHMAGRANFACLILTAEDEDAGGNFHARENVIHELGLFRGRLGFSRAITLVEEGTVEFSNIHGIQQLRFNKDRIKETFGDVLATLRREFGAG